MRHKRRALALLLAAIAAVHGAVWLAAAQSLRAGIAEWTAARRAEGTTVEFGALDIGGYPFRLAARMAAPHAHRALGPAPFDWRGPLIHLEITPWAPGTPRLVFPGAHRIDSPLIAGGTAELASEQATARMRISGANTSEAAVRLGGLSIMRPATASIAALALDLGFPPPDAGVTAPALRDPASLTLRIEASAIALPSASLPVAFAGGIERIVLQGSLHGRVTGARFADALGAWRDGGGTLELASLALRWGALDLDADGTFALDQDMQPMAALTARVNDHGAALDALVRASLIAPAQAAAAKVVFDLMASRPPGGPTVLPIPLTVQDRRLSIGPVALIRLPRVDW